MAFNRVVELKIGADGTGLLISDLHIEFNITRSNKFEENIANFVVYNAKEDTRKKVLKEKNNLIFDAGYEDEGTGTIFVGNITKAESRQEGSDWITEIEAATIQTVLSELVNNYIELSFTADTPIAQPLNAIATAVGLGVFGIENAAGILLSNGFVHAGSTRSALVNLNKILQVNNAALFADNNEIVIYRTDSSVSRFSPILLNYQSGLINISDITEKDNQKKKSPKRVSIESIIIPKLKPLVLVNIKNTNKLEGVYFAEKVVTSGDNFGGGFNMVTEAAA